MPDYYTPLPHPEDIDGHPNATGYQIIAAQIAATVEKDTTQR